MKYFTNKAIEKSSLIVVPSNYFENEFKLRHGDKKDIYIYPSGGVDTNKFYPMPQNKESFNIGYVGRITTQKGVGVLLDAVKQLKISFKLYIVGDGPELDYYKNYAKDIKLQDSVIFIGAVKNNELVNYYNIFDLFVFPTMRKAESFGNVAIESMACKIPIIGSKIAGLNDYIFEGENGFFFDVGNSKQLMDTINRFYLMTEEEKNQMKEKAYLVAMKYEKNILNKKFIQKLKELIIMLHKIKLIIYYLFISKLLHSRFFSLANKIRLYYLEKVLKIKLTTNNKEYKKSECVENNVYISDAKNIKIGYGVQINENVFIQGAKIGNFVMIAPNVAILNSSHNFNSTSHPMALQGKTKMNNVTINDDVWIGRNVIVMPGVKVGKGCIIGAGSILTKDTIEYGIYAGVPAKLIKKRIK